MGPTSDLGPVDPQFQNPSGPGLYSAKDLIAAVEAAERAVTNNPDTYALHASLLADVNALMVRAGEISDGPDWRSRKGGSGATSTATQRK